MPKLHKNIEERSLVKGCQNGDHHCQKHLFETYKDKMMGVAIRYLPEQQQAEDILIRSFTKVFSNIRSFRSEGSLEGWIRRIVINESLAQLRKEGPSKWSVSLENISQDPGIGAEVYDMLSTTELLGIISSLPQGYRTVFNLYAVEGFSHKEIASQLRISEGTSKSQYLRARSLLRKKIGKMNSIKQKVDYGS